MKRNAKKERFHCVLTMESPLQRSNRTTNKKQQWRHPT